VLTQQLAATPPALPPPVAAALLALAAKHERAVPALLMASASISLAGASCCACRGLRARMRLQPLAAALSAQRQSAKLLLLLVISVTPFVRVCATSKPLQVLQRVTAEVGHHVPCYTWCTWHRTSHAASAPPLGVHDVHAMLC
jgi:hypothetical protein